VVFTTIQKFFPEERGDRHPVLSDRRNIVVIADEAHRSQYDFIDGFARHMRDALPNASFIGFTGTPIELTDANTRAVFGDYISVYDIQRAVQDGHGPDLLRKPAGQAGAARVRAPKIDPEFEEATEGEEVEPQGEAQEQVGAAGGGCRVGEPHQACRPRPGGALREPARGHGRQGHDRVHEPAHLRRAVRRDRGAAAQVAQR
jgi:hypothetical protein